MRKEPLYSRSSRFWTAGRPGSTKSPNPFEGNGPAGEPPLSQTPRRATLLRKVNDRLKLPLWVAAGGLVVLWLVYWHASLTPSLHPLTQKEIDAAVLRTLEAQTLPSPAAKACAAIRPSVVRMPGLDTGQDGDDEVEEGRRNRGGHRRHGDHSYQPPRSGRSRAGESGLRRRAGIRATVIGLKPENDLAVLQAKTIPDDLAPATLGSTRDLALGDHVVAVGFPFGIGPSVSAGVVSG